MFGMRKQAISNIYNYGHLATAFTSYSVSDPDYG